jgi:hypothetical protein
MSISVDRARKHIANYSNGLSGSSKYWPEFLFHACPVETAIAVLNRGELISRAALERIDRDVANQSAVNNNPAAHPFVRLYFRPLTMFHLRTEGLKCVSHPHRLEFHMSVPILFLFDSQALLTRDGTGFTDRNFAIAGVTPGFDERAFNQIPFPHVYHNAALPPDIGPEVRTRRMAEVVVPDRLPLAGNLRLIVCRTQNDATTLKHMLGVSLPNWEHLVHVEQIPRSVFFHKALYVRSLTPAQNALVISLKPPEDHIVRTCHLRIVNCQDGTLLTDNPNFPVGYAPVQIALQNLNRIQAIRIEIDGALAFQGPIQTRVSELIA